MLLRLKHLIHLLLPIALSLHLCSCTDPSAEDLVYAHNDHSIHAHDTENSVNKPISDYKVQINNIKNGLVHGSVRGGWFGAQDRLTNKGLPKNSRQTLEGYWVGSNPDIEQIHEMNARQIKLVLTFATIPSKELKTVTEAYESLGIKHVYLPFGSKFPNPNLFMPFVNETDPSQIFIHCAHGSDRTGAVLAYILIARHHWDIPSALFSVILPTPCNVQKLTQILNSQGFKVDPASYEDIIGIYSAENNNGYGGLKVCNNTGNYIRLINTLIKRAKLINNNDTAN